MNMRYALAINSQRFRTKRYFYHSKLVKRINCSKEPKSILRWWHLWKLHLMKFTILWMMLSMVKHIIAWWESSINSFYLIFFFKINYFQHGFVISFSARNTWPKICWRIEWTCTLVVVDAKFRDFRNKCVTSADFAEFFQWTKTE